LVGALWSKPQSYAQFLGQELPFVYRGRLLIVMPNGYGIARDGKPFPSERKLLDRNPPPERTRTDLATAASQVVLGLARRKGVELKLPPLSPPPRQDDSRGWIYIVSIALSIVALIVVRRPRGTKTQPKSPRKRSDLRCPRSDAEE
jgi:hypothetical protein